MKTYSFLCVLAAATSVLAAADNLAKATAPSKFATVTVKVVTLDGQVFPKHDSVPVSLYKPDYVKGACYEAFSEADDNTGSVTFSNVPPVKEMMLMVAPVDLHTTAAGKTVSDQLGVYNLKFAPHAGENYIEVVYPIALADLKTL